MTGHMTTVKVRKETRELISRAARAESSTIDHYLTRLVTDRIWRERMDMARRMMTDPDHDYLGETESWDTAAADGLG